MPANAPWQAPSSANTLASAARPLVAGLFLTDITPPRRATRQALLEDTKGDATPVTKPVAGTGLMALLGRPTTRVPVDRRASAESNHRCDGQRGSKTWRSGGTRWPYMFLDRLPATRGSSLTGPVEEEFQKDADGERSQMKIKKGGPQQMTAVPPIGSLSQPPSLWRLPCAGTRQSPCPGFSRFWASRRLSWPSATGPLALCSRPRGPSAFRESTRLASTVC